MLIQDQRACKNRAAPFYKIKYDVVYILQIAYLSIRELIRPTRTAHG